MMMPCSLRQRNPLVPRGHPAEARASSPHLRPNASRLRGHNPLLRPSSPALPVAPISPPLKRQAEPGSGEAPAHSSCSELACDSQQISDTWPKFRQVLGRSDVTKGKKTCSLRYLKTRRRSGDLAGASQTKLRRVVAIWALKVPSNAAL